MNAAGNHSFRLSYLLDGQPVQAEFDRPRVLLGRETACDLVLPAKVAGVSRRHAVITRENGDWVINDLGSVNGTFINEVRITSQALHDGDVLNLGPIKLNFHLNKRSVVSAPPQVQFDDAPTRGDLASIIKMEDLDQLFVSRLRRHSSQRVQAIQAVRAARGEAPPPTPETAEESQELPGVAWVIHLFSQVSKAVLSSDNLDSLLEKVMDLVFADLPAQRGFLCLCDEKTGAVVPRVVRNKGARLGETITISRSITREVIQSKNSVLVRDTKADERFSAAQSIQLQDIRSALCAPLYHDGNVSGLIYVDTHNTEAPFTEQHLELLSALAVLSAVGVEQTRLRQDIVREQGIRDRLARYSSPAVVEQIVQNAANFSADMVAEEREVTVIFSDLCGFTTMSEDLAPTDVARTLNELFERFTEVIFQHDGTLDKYRGDGLMAVFGAPLSQPDHAERAVRTALLMHKELAAYNQANPDNKPMAMRIGINSGPVVAGDIGSPKRKDYTVIGDTVNVASRLEAMVAKPGQVVIGPLTRERVASMFQCQALPPIQLKGKQKLVQPYLVRGTHEATTSKFSATEIRSAVRD